MRETPRFCRVDAVVATAWVAAFAVAAVSLALVLAAAPHATTLVIVIKALSSALPAGSTAWKRAWRALTRES
ncbi:carboxylesterase type B [Nonomuraea thailandensis]|uniref:Carboxylesterase type B n=1 Tax=Nonomuraea thailandensis TaxID=1188745 RepID=A0A9X2GTK9_9ACTN|nr:hypothetical protein [Nonomuraea thailandensis]MCP2363424.1 carboxylesterase type B [Nonomuraea thailandensis]